MFLVKLNVSHKSEQNLIVKMIKMRTNMNKVFPVIASVGVGIAAYQMMSNNGGKMKNMLPLASGMMRMGNTGLQAQDQQQPLNNQ
jgi:hypothetical protein